MKRYVIAKYIRLSLEDTKYDSLSIENQRLVIDTHIAGMPESDCAEILEFVDNGYSGTNFKRPEVQRLIELVRTNRVDCIHQQEAYFFCLESDQRYRRYAH